MRAWLKKHGFATDATTWYWALLVALICGILIWCFP